MSIVRDSVVRFHYRLSNEDGVEIENSHENEPVTYLHGHGTILPALEQQLEGRGPGDTFSALLSAADRFDALGAPVQHRLRRLIVRHRARCDV